MSRCAAAAAQVICLLLAATACSRSQVVPTPGPAVTPAPYDADWTGARASP